MKIIIDAQLSPHLAGWIYQTFQIESYSVAFLGLRDAADTAIFNYARHENAIVMTKDEDFVQLYYKLGVPPQIIWITTGNTSNDYMRNLLS